MAEHFPLQAAARQSTAGNPVSDVGWLVASEHAMRDYDTVDVAVQI